MVAHPPYTQIRDLELGGIHQVRGEQHGKFGMAATACYSAGATGSVWHHMGSGYTNLCCSQDSTNPVKMQTAEGIGWITGLANM